MSSCSGSVCLLVLLGVVFASGSPLYVSDDLKSTHKSIAEALELGRPEVGSSPLFSAVIRNINTSCQRKEEVQLMNVTLDVYTRIFSSILERHHRHQHGKSRSTPLLDQVLDTKRNKVASALMMLKEKMEKLKENLCHLNDDREDIIGKLNKLEVDDPNVQRKALAEYLEIYQATSLIGSHKCA